MMDGPLARDPLDAIGPMCASLVLAFLGPRDLARCGAVNHSWRALALLDGQQWEPHLAKLWDGKVYVPNAFRELAQASPARAYSGSLRDASSRQLPTEEELGRFTWTLGFKTISWFSASLGSLNMHRYFNPNHTITAPPDDPLWGDAEVQRHFWYFRPGPDGSTVLQVNTYPHLTCSRTPDWGWELSNAIVKLTIDAAAGPNPGIPPGHPAARETLSLAQIEARFNALLLLEGEEEDEDSDDCCDDGDGDDGGDAAAAPDGDHDEEKEEEKEKENEGGDHPVPFPPAN